MNEPSRVTTLALFVLAVAGRFTPGRAGLSAPPWFDLRLAGVLLVVALVLLDRSRTRPVGRADGADDGWLVALLLLLGFLAGSGLWAPTGARVAEITVDLLCLGVQTVCWYLHALSGPERVLDLVLRLWVVTALVFGAGALLAGPGAQGRFAAFGGGPNVFVRIELIGALAVVALVLRGASRALLPVAALLVVLGLLSGSRGGLLAAAVVVAAVALRGGRRARRAVVGGLVTVAGVAFVASRSSPQVQALVRGRFLDQTFGQGYASGRPQIWGDAVALAASRPVAGVGLDGFYALRGRFVDIEYPHNVLLAVMAEGGRRRPAAPARCLRTMVARRPQAAAGAGRHLGGGPRGRLRRRGQPVLRGLLRHPARVRVRRSRRGRGHRGDGPCGPHGFTRTAGAPSGEVVPLESASCGSCPKNRA